MQTYKEIKNADGSVSTVFRSDGWSIPFDPANTDYQAYLQWLEEGNETLPADNANDA